MVARQYPYMLQVSQISGGGFDGEGHPVPTNPSFVDYAKCRDEANAGGKTINLLDGEMHVFDSLVQLPKGTNPVKIGTRIQVMNGLEIRVSGTVKRFQKDQMHSRLWV